MTNSVKIVADSGCDLPSNLVNQYDITIVPVFVRFGAEAISTDQLTNDAFWARAASSPAAPATAAPAAGTFQRVFQTLVEAGHDVVCMTLTARHSGTFNAAWVAAQEFGARVRVIDSGSFSLGLGLQVLALAKEALAGQSSDWLQHAAESLRRRTSIFFMLDTLEWVRRGGRLDRVVPLVDRVARTLHVKPIIEMSDGEFRLVAVVRSTRSALQRLEDEVRNRLPIDALATAYTRGCDVAAELWERMAQAAQRQATEIMLAEVGPVFAAHAGPKALGAVVVRGHDK
jgi:DegV family protein with EDD domain